MTPQDFIRKWRNAELKERSAAQEHFIDLCRLLGEPTRKLLWVVYLLGSVLTATAVSIAGNIGFVGLIVPHLMRLLVGSDHRVLLPSAALFGGLFLVLSDTLARTVLAPRQLPVGVVTALLGVPLFLMLLNRARVKQ